MGADPPTWGREDLEQLLRHAARAVDAAVRDRPFEDPQPVDRPALSQPGGAFVTMRREGRLAGCIGFVESPSPLWDTVARAARSAALDDPRFPAVGIEDLPTLSIEVSVLTPPQPIQASDVRPGTHGLLLRHPQGSGLLLPQVATEHGLGREGFLAAIGEKAGVGPEAWHDEGAQLLAFEAQVLGAPLLRLLGPDPPGPGR